MVTLTGVELSRDQSHAKVFFTVLGSARTRRDACEGLQHAAGFLRSALAHRLTTRTVPQLHFEYDESVERGVRLSRLIDEAVKPRPPRPRAGRAAAEALRRVPMAAHAGSLDGVLLLDKPAGITLHARARQGQAAARRAQGAATPARSIPSPPGCCRSSSARPPSSRDSCIDSREGLRRDAAPGRGDADGRHRRARWSQRATWTWMTAESMPRCDRLRRARSRSCRRCTRRCTWTAGGSTTTRVPAREVERPPRTRRGPRARRTCPARRRLSTSACACSQGHLRAHPRRRTSARALGCGAHLVALAAHRRRRASFSAEARRPRGPGGEPGLAAAASLLPAQVLVAGLPRWSGSKTRPRASATARRSPARQRPRRAKSPFSDPVAASWGWPRGRHGRSPRFASWSTGRREAP